MKSVNLILLFLAFLAFHQCTAKKAMQKTPALDTLYTLQENTGKKLALEFTRGEAHNYPSFVLWAEDTAGNYLKTLFITRSMGTGTFGYGKVESGQWVSGEKVYPAALPHWSHKRGIETTGSVYMPDAGHPMPDAVTAATPQHNFVLYTVLGKEVSLPLVVKFEINQTWDFNEYWTNNKYPGNEAYKRSCQPSLVYAAKIETDVAGKKHAMIPVGHGHYAGENGKLYPDISTLTTAKKIVQKLQVGFVK
jgi:hypothetical protein